MDDPILQVSVAASEGVEDAEELSDELEQALAEQAVKNDAKFAELNKGVTECLDRLQRLSNQLKTVEPATESPLLNQMSREVTEIRAEISDLRNQLTSAISKLSNREPSRLETPEPEVISIAETGSENDGTEQLTVAPKQVAPPAPAPNPRRHRMI